MSNQYRLIGTLSIALALVIGCGRAQPTATCVPPTSTPASLLGPDFRGKASVSIYGGDLHDYLYDILLLADGGTLLAGRANSSGFSHRITPGNARLIRTDSQGQIIWERDYGGEDDAMFYSVVQVGQDEYVVLGQIAASYEREETDFYLVKIDGEGNEIWSHTYGGRGMDHAKMVRQTSDGGYILLGGRSDEFLTGDVYQADIVLVKTDAEGNEVWTRTYGDEILYLGWAVAQTPDGGYVLSGWEARTIPDRDAIAMKTNAMGDVEWSLTWDLDPGERDGAFDSILTSDGHVVIACIQSMNSGPRGAVLIKVDLEGNEVWRKLIGQAGVGNEFWDVMEDLDRGYVVSGSTLPGKIPGTTEDIRRALVIKTDQDGEVLWHYVFERDEYKQASLSSGAVLPDGGYVFVGQCSREGENYTDMFWLKLMPEGEEASSGDAAGRPAGARAPVAEGITVDTIERVERLHTLSGHGNRVAALAFSANGAFLASASWDDTIRLWDVTSWEEVHAFGPHEVDLNGIAFSKDGSLLASAAAIWDVESLQVLHRLEWGAKVSGQVAFSPDGMLLVVHLRNEPIRVWDVASGEVVRAIVEDPDNPVLFSIAISPDGALLAAGGREGTVSLWDLASGKIADRLEHGNQSDVHDVEFSPDGTLLASGGTDYTARLWDLESGEVVHTLRHGNGLYGLTFSPDGSLLATAVCDRTVKIWDVATGKSLRSLRHADEVMTVAFSPDGSLLAAAGYDDIVYLWGVPQ